MEIDKSQAEVLQVLRDISNSLNLPFEIERDTDILGIYRIVYRTKWLQGAFQYTCITNPNGITTIDMEILGQQGLRNVRYVPIPEVTQRRFHKYYNSTLSPALSAAFSQSDKSYSNQNIGSTNEKKENTNQDIPKAEKFSDSDFKVTTVAKQSNNTAFVIVGIIVFFFGIYIYKQSTKYNVCQCQPVVGFTTTLKSRADMFEWCNKKYKGWSQDELVNKCSEELFENTFND
jgi:hypothetical protein